MAGLKVEGIFKWRGGGDLKLQGSLYSLGPTVSNFHLIAYNDNS